MAQQIMVGGAVVGFTNPLRTYRAYNLDVTTFAVAFAALAAGDRLYACGHGVRVDGVKGGVLDLDSGTSFAGFAPTGTGVPGVAPYPALGAAAPRVAARLHHCWTGRDPDDAGPRRSVADSLGGATGIATEHAHAHEAHNDLQVEVEDGPAAGEATGPQRAAALAAVRALVPGLVNLMFPDQYAGGQAAIDAAVPPLGGMSVVSLHLTYSDVGGGGDPPDVGNVTVASCEPAGVERTFIVNTSADVSDGNTGDGVCDTGNAFMGFTGICTLRAALAESDVTAGMQAIRFNIPGAGVPIIRPRSILGNLGAIGPLIIDATTQPGGLVAINGAEAGPSGIGLRLAGEGGTVRGLVIDGFALDGIEIASTGEPGVPGGHLIEQSLIGTDASGSLAVPNGRDGIRVMRSDNIIRDNVIGGNGGPGIGIRTADATGNTVVANFIGTNRGGSVVGNAGAGVLVEPTATGSRLGQNTIGFNGGLAIDLGGDGPTPNDPLDADIGANNLQNVPEVTAANALSATTAVQGILRSAANANFILDFFATASCSGSALQIPLSSREVSTDGSGIGTFAAMLEAAVPAGQFITATTGADEDGNTSEHSFCVPVLSVPQGLSVWLNSATYQAGEELMLTAALTPIAPPIAVDAYVVVRIPTGQFLSLQLGGAIVPGIVPIARSFVPFALEAPILRYTLSGTEPPGVYTWFAVLTLPGTLTFVSPLDAKTFIVH